MSYSTIRMQTLHTNILLESQSNAELVGNLALSNITLLRELGVVTSNEDYTDLAHVLAETSLESEWVSEQAKEDIRGIISNEQS